MTIYCISLALIVFLSLSIRNNRVCIVAFGLVVWFLAAFRDLNLGILDTTGTYYRLFCNSRIHTFRELFEGALGYENLFWCVITKFLQLFVGNSYQLYIAIISAIIIGCFCAAIIYASNQFKWSTLLLMLSCIIFFSTVYFFLYTMIRQFAAMSIIACTTYPSLNKKKPLGYFISIIISGAIHSTALIFLPVYFICNIAKYRLFWLYLCIGIAIIGSLVPKIILSILNAIPILQTRMGYLMHGVYSDETSTMGYGTLLFLTVVVLLCIYHFSDFSDAEMSNLFWIASFGIIFQGWSHVIVEFYRVAFYFNFFIAILIPARLSFVSSKASRQYIAYFAILAFTFYGLVIIATNAQVDNYQFCWDIGAWRQ